MTDNTGKVLKGADKNKHPIEVERPMAQDAKPASEVPVAPVLDDKRMDFKADARRLAAMDGTEKGVAGITITDKKKMTLPNGLTVENF